MEFCRLESIVKMAEKEVLKAARALRVIRDSELYLPPHTTFGTFEEYVENTFTFGVRTAQHRIQYANRADACIEAGTDPPATVAQSRALSMISEGDRICIWKGLVEEYGSAETVPPKAIAACKQASSVPGDDDKTCDTPLDDQGPQPAADRPTESWQADAARALRDVPKAHRDAVAAEVNAFAAEVEGGKVEPWMVAETADGYRAAVLEDGHSQAPEDGGEGYRGLDDEPDGSADRPITDLVVLPDRELVHARKFKRGTLFLGTDERKPLLVALPRAVVPASLAADLRPDAKSVVVELGELGRHGGPVRSGGQGKGPVLDLAEVRAAALAVGVQTTIQTTNEHVDWARRTINPVTGCQHACMYIFCYAAGIARRLFAQGFLPTLHPTRLDAFSKSRVPNISGLTSEDAWRERSVFVVSMGDLFGKWIPRWYVEAVLDEIRQNPQWFCFLLTKHPEGLAGYEFPSNCAVGLTLTGDEATDRKAQDRIYRKYAKALRAVSGAAFTWLSIEPFRGEIYDLTPFVDAGVAMVAVGGQSRTVLAPPKPGDKLIIVPAAQPSILWVESVRAQCERAGVMVFEKANLTVKRKDIPWPDGRPDA